MCQIDTFIHVQYHYVTVHYSNKLDKTDVLVVGDCSGHVRLLVSDKIIVVRVLLLRLSIKQKV
jgi:hypothetical protein